MSRRRMIAVSTLCLAFATTTTPSQVAQAAVRGRPEALRTAWIVFSDDQVTPNRFAVRAFVPTGSRSDFCLATLSESNFAGPGQTVFCAPREHQGRRGVVFSVFVHEPIPPGMILAATLWHAGARYYGEPVFFCPAEEPNC